MVVRQTPPPSREAPKRANRRERLRPRRRHLRPNRAGAAAPEAGQAAPEPVGHRRPATTPVPCRRRPNHRKHPSGRRFSRRPPPIRNCPAAALSRPQASTSACTRPGRRRWRTKEHSDRAGTRNVAHLKRARAETSAALEATTMPTRTPSALLRQEASTEEADWQGARRRKPVTGKQRGRKLSVRPDRQKQLRQSSAPGDSAGGWHIKAGARRGARSSSSPGRRAEAARSETTRQGRQHQEASGGELRQEWRRGTSPELALVGSSSPGGAQRPRRKRAKATPRRQRGRRRQRRLARRRAPGGGTPATPGQPPGRPRRNERRDRAGSANYPAPEPTPRTTLACRRSRRRH